MVKQQGCDFNKELSDLNNNGPLNLYTVYGQEDYLRDLFISELKKRCVGDEESFGYYRYDGIPSLDALSTAIETFPFLTERSFIEIRNANINKLSEDYISLFSSIPEFCTVCLICANDFEADNRTKAIKYLKANSKYLIFEAQDTKKLVKWIQRRFNSLNKSISTEAAERLIFISGDLMNRLIPEIDKIATYSNTSEITIQDINDVANHIPESDAFDLVNLLSNKKNDEALVMLSDLLKQKNMEPIMIISALSYQFRQLYGAKIGAMNERTDFRSKMVMQSASKFSKKQLVNFVNSCAHMEYNMKTSLYSDNDILINCIIEIITEK